MPASYPNAKSTRYREISISGQGAGSRYREISISGQGAGSRFLICKESVVDCGYQEQRYLRCHRISFATEESFMNTHLFLRPPFWAFIGLSTQTVAALAQPAA